MTNPTVRFQRLKHGEGLPLPAYKSDLASGFDLSAALGPYTVGIPPGGRATIPTGFNIAIDPGYEGQCRPRSGLAAHNGISIVNTPGTIDADYRGEINVILINHGNEIFYVRRGDRIAQLVIAPVSHANVHEVSTLDTTARGEGGFGSTGVS